MRLLWIVIALALIQCNYGEEDDSTVSAELIDEVFNRDTKPGNEATDDPNLTPKLSNVSQSRAMHYQILPKFSFRQIYIFAVAVSTFDSHAK